MEHESIAYGADWMPSAQYHECASVDYAVRQEQCNITDQAERTDDLTSSECGSKHVDTQDTRDSIGSFSSSGTASNLKETEPLQQDVDAHISHQNEHKQHQSASTFVNTDTSSIDIEKSEKQICHNSTKAPSEAASIDTPSAHKNTSLNNTNTANSSTIIKGSPGENEKVKECALSTGDSGIQAHISDYLSKGRCSNTADQIDVSTIDDGLSELIGEIALDQSMIATCSFYDHTLHLWRVQLCKQVMN